MKVSDLSELIVYLDRNLHFVFANPSVDHCLPGICLGRDKTCANEKLVRKIPKVYKCIQVAEVVGKSQVTVLQPMLISKKKPK